MADETVTPGRFSGLSNKLIAAIIAVILLVEIVVYLPSLASFRANWLDDRLRVGVVAARVLDAVPDVMALPHRLIDRLLTSAGLEAIVYRRAGRSQMIELAEPVTPVSVVTADMRQSDLISLVGGAFDTLLARPGRTLRIVGEGGVEESLVEILMPEAPLRREMIDYSRNILLISLGIAAVTAFVLYMLVSRLFILPMQRLTRNILNFRIAPENAALILRPTPRRDEIGIMERELAAMEHELFSMLRKQRHLAELGLAVAKINHDLRNTLSAAQLLSDQVATLNDPKVQRLAPRLVTTLDKAISFAQSVIDYGHEAANVPELTAVDLRALVDDAAFEARLLDHAGIEFANKVPAGLTVLADAGQMGRVFVNLLKNAREALEQASQSQASQNQANQSHAGLARPGRVEVAAATEGEGVRVSVADNGPGLPPRAKENLFIAFEGSARAGGTGLGLAIARELTLANGGTLDYAADGAQGTRFDLTLALDRDTS